MNQKLRVAAVGVGALMLCTACGTSKPNAAAKVTVPTKAQVTAGMLTAGDVPAGYKLVPSANSSGATGKGPDATCSDLAEVVLGTTLPGAVFEVDRDFDSASGMSISESVAPFDTTAAATAMAKRFSTDAAGCPSLTISQGGMSATFNLSVGTKPSAGTLGTTVTLTGTGIASGVTEVTTFVLDGATAVGVTAPTAQQADDLTTLALSKLDKAVAGSSS